MQAQGTDVHFQTSPPTSPDRPTEFRLFYDKTTTLVFDDEVVSEISKGLMVLSGIVKGSHASCLLNVKGIISLYPE